MIKEYCFLFSELNIVAEDLSALLGFDNNEVPEPFPDIIKQALKDAPQYCDIRGGYKIFESIEISQKEALISIKDKTFSPSKIVATQLKDATSAAIFVCTAGAEISDHSMQVSNQGDPMLSYIYDVIGSVTVEKAMDLIQKSLDKELQKSELNISDRYSPGYCEWSVAEQQYLFQLLPKSFCNISLSDSSLMDPIKSVSGIIGIGANLKQKGYQCHWCTDKNCIYGRIKVSILRTRS